MINPGQPPPETPTPRSDLRRAAYLNTATGAWARVVGWDVLVLGCWMFMPMSDRAIAVEIGTDHKVVSRARKRTGAQAPVGKRTGKDGKARKMPKRKSKAKVRKPRSALGTDRRCSGSNRKISESDRR
jgi:hypothetical protein